MKYKCSVIVWNSASYEIFCCTDPDPYIALEMSGYSTKDRLGDGSSFEVEIWRRMILRIEIDQATKCWNWTGAKYSSGYGYVRRLKGGIVAGESMTHRIMYRLIAGDIPDGFDVDHLCRNTSCCNPSHLEPVTPATNTLRGMGAGAIHSRKEECLNGHPLHGDNVRIYTDKLGRSTRMCKECRRSRGRKHMRNRRLKLKLHATQPKQEGENRGLGSKGG